MLIINYLNSCFFINLFFIGLLYTAFCHQKAHSELDLFLKKNA